MTTTVKQVKIYDGLFDPEVPIDMAPNDPTEDGNLVVILWMAQTDNPYFELKPFNMDELVPVDGINAFSGFRQSISNVEGYVGGVLMGPTQPLIDEYYQVSSVGSAEATSIQIVLYELTSSVGDLVPWGSYLIGNPATNIQDWFAVNSGYNKPRSVLVFGMNPPGDGAPTFYGLDENILLVGNPVSNFHVRMGEVEWEAGESHPFTASGIGFTGFVVSVAEQSRYSNVQHIETAGGNAIVPSLSGVAVSDKSLLILSARYKNFDGPFTLLGWNLLSKTSLENTDRLTVVVWWRQVDLSVETEQYAYTVPGSPLNLNFREVSGFTELVKLGTYTYLDNTADPTGLFDDDGDSFDAAGFIALQQVAGFALPVGNFPDNDAYFYSVMAFPAVQDWAFNLPDQKVHLNKALVDSGEGWDFYPDGYFGANIIGGGSSMIHEGGSEGEWVVPDSDQQVVAAGAIFFNVPVADTVINEPVWTKTVDPTSSFENYLIFVKILGLVPDFDDVSHRQTKIATLQATIATLQTALADMNAEKTSINVELGDRAGRLAVLEA